MRRYELEKEREGSTVYFFIRDVETLDIVLLPTKYLMHKIRSKCSPNTVRRSALAILYYLEYIHEKKKELTDVYQMPYVELFFYVSSLHKIIQPGQRTEKVSLPRRSFLSIFPHLEPCFWGNRITLSTCLPTMRKNP